VGVPTVTASDNSVAVDWPIERRDKADVRDVQKSVVVNGVEYSATIKEIMAPPGNWEVETTEKRALFITERVPVTETIYFSIIAYEIEWWPETKYGEG
jgi:hypothetical protein